MLQNRRKHLQPLLEEQPKILETMGSIVAARQQQLDAIKSSKAENRRLALIARMQRLFSQAGQETSS